MKRETRSECAVLAVVLLVLGLAFTAFTYAALYFMALVVLSSFVGRPRIVCHAVACVYLVATTVALLRQDPDYWTGLRFNTSDPKNRVVADPGGANNVNPLGPDSVRSYAKLGAGCLSPGPHCLIEAWKSLRSCLRGPQ